MATLTPVDFDPFASAPSAVQRAEVPAGVTRVTVNAPGPKLVPVDHDPFAGSAPSSIYDQAADIAKGFGGGLIRGTAGTIGLVTDTIPGWISEGLNFLEAKATGASPEEMQSRIADRRANSPLRQFSPELADAARSVGEHLTTKGLQQDIESVTGPAYVPHTRAGKFASTAGEFVPGAMIGGLPNMARNAVAYGVVPGLVSEGTGQVFEGGPMEGPARLVGGLAGGLASAGALRNSTAVGIVGKNIGDVTPQQIDAAEQLFQRAAQAGQPISRAEALQAVTNGRSGIGDLQHTVEGMGGMKPFYAQRPAQNEAAARRAFDGIAPQSADPSQLGPTIGGHAEQIVTDVRQAINRATRPMYDAAGQHLVPRQIHDAMMADPLFAQTVDMIRRDPALNAVVRAASDRSVRMYDEVAKQLEQRSRNAGNPLNTQQNQTVSAVTGNLGGDVKNIAIAADRAAVNGPSSYEAALANQARYRQQYLEPLLNGPIGKIAGRDTKTRDAINALFPANPLAGSADEIGNAVRALSSRSPNVARQLVRTHAEMTFNEATQRLAGGPNQSGGAKFAAILRGNPQQAANLEAAVRALPNGNQIWPGFNNFLEILEAQQWRQATGSRTAFKIPGVENLKGGGLLNNAGQIVASGGFKWPQKAMQAIQNWNVGRNLDDLARLLTDPAAANQFRAIATAPRGSSKALALAARLAVMSNSGARVESRPGVSAAR
mgnify:CR=1 FL=1